MLNLEKILSMSEGKTIEFKQDLSSLQPIMKTLVAFANTAGGTLIIGKEDGGSVIGIEDIFEAEERLANAISDSIAPRLMPDIDVISLNGKSLLVVRVAHWPGPFYIKAKGSIEGVFIRIGSTNRIAGQEWLNELETVRTKVTFDQKPCLDTENSDLDMDEITKVFSEEKKNIDQNKLITLGILVQYGQKLIPSNGGIILFGKKSVREKYFPNATIRCARFLGSDKVEFLDQRDVEESILESMQEILSFIRRNTRLSSKIEEIKREDIPEYSPIIVREVLTNALVHADYSIRGMHPRVMIFSDRMEIESPGILPLGYTLEDFTAGISHIRNKVLARTFRELKKMEEWGTGYKRIAEVCLQKRYPMPKWEELGPCLKVTLYPYSIKELDDFKNTPLSPRQKDLLQLFCIEDKFTAKEIHAKLKSPISERTLRTDLQQLKKLGFLSSIGSGPGTYWICNKNT